MSAPKRIQRKRTKGWRMPEGAVYVGRPGKWGNPFKADDRVSRAHAVTLYREFVTTWNLSDPWLIRDLGRLAGRDLACWCPLDQPCHADVLLELANRTNLPPVEGSDESAAA